MHAQYIYGYQTEVMPIYVPSDIITLILTIAYIRQNCWKKIDDVFESIIKSKRIHIPWTHTKSTIDALEAGEDIPRGNRYATICKDIETGSLVLIPDGKKGLIVRITSGIKSGVFDTICMACTPRSCGHPNITECDMCRSSIVEAFNPSNSQKLLAHLKNGCLIEPFWSPYRDVEIIGEADYNGIDGRSMAGLDSAGKWQRYWRLKE
jgi:hypothetical protein